MMNMYKKIIFAVFVVISLIILSSCGNRQILLDTNQSFTRAWIKLDNMYVEKKIKAWRDFKDGDEVQIIDEDGTVYLTHYCNVVLMSK